MENVDLIMSIWYTLRTFGIPYGHLEYLTAIWYFLLPFGIFSGHLVPFSQHMLYQERSGNPVPPRRSSYFRGVKIVGPFVIMIYRMITGDLLRFVTIYAIFAIGFSQGM
jgi:hypothetical protein